MDVTIMQSTASVLKSLKANYPQFSFKLGDAFLWSSSDNTIYYTKSDDQAIFLLHELAHALLGHSSYNRDIELITMERQAWDYTIKLAPQYGVAISNDVVQLTLDSYRDWIHDRSTCPKCKATGIQIDKYTYSCPACDQQWRVNEARTCALRRYDIQNN